MMSFLGWPGRWLYEAFSWLADHREPLHTRALHDRFQDPRRLPLAAGERTLIAYVPTIGEYRAVRPLLQRLCSGNPPFRIVLLTAQEQYLEPIARDAPEAAVGLPPGPQAGRVAALFDLVRPVLVLFAEGPSIHGYFPIRTDLSLAYQCARRAIPLVVVNACVYERNLASRIDRLEHRLFGANLLATVSAWYTPWEHFRAQLLALGAPPARVKVVGDLKIDGQASSTPAPRPPELSRFLEDLKATAGPVVVAGSVSAIDEQLAVIAGWQQLRRQHHDARLILAPRYLHERAGMDALFKALDDQGLSYARRSQGLDRCRSAPIVILDVMGELPLYYEIAAVAYAGRNHGVLEALRCGVPTVVAPNADWRKDNSSYPLYRLMVEEGALLQVEDKQAIGASFIRVTADPEFRALLQASAREALRKHQGATDAIIADLRHQGWLPAA
jgi:3-deoxy-D-manno-octulosonic-acid transferase